MVNRELRGFKWNGDGLILFFVTILLLLWMVHYEYHFQAFTFNEESYWDKFVLDYVIVYNIY